MSGLWAILRLDGRAVDDMEVAAVAEPLRRRGPDGLKSWKDGPVALGHALLATTPEALVESLPLTEHATGCTITGDARLDNREELLAALGQPGDEGGIGDGELILRAYLRWGEQCAQHLLGDFAFAIWDPREQRLFCGRDHMGLKQLHYCHLADRLLIVATDAEAVIAHPGVPRRLYEGRIGDFLDGLEGIDLTSTYFHDVRRLPPAHVLSARGHKLELRRYWQLELPPALKLESDKAYVAAFRDVFTQAVRCRLRASGPVGAMVSGGLDSSSAAVVAGSIAGAGNVRSFSGVNVAGAECRETRAIRSVLATGMFKSTTISFADLEPCKAALSEAVKDIADPFDAHMNLVRAVYCAAQREGVRVVLDGVGGDLAFNSGNRIAQLLRQARPRDAFAEARGEAAFWDGQVSPVSLMLKAAWAGLVPRPIRLARRRLQALREDRRALAGRASLGRAFARRIALVRRRALYGRHLAGTLTVGRDYQLRHITHPHTVAARERYERVASRFGVEPRDPFLDIRVLRFCLALPREQLRSGGWTKLLLRRAMASLLPDDVAWRRGKDHLGPQFTEALIHANPSWMAKWPGMRAKLQGLIPDDEASGVDGATELNPKKFIELFSLACWLSRYDVPRG